VLPECELWQARAIAVRAVSVQDAPELEDLPGVTISAGAVQLRDGESGEQAVARAEMQVRAAKETGD
jgi:hypothetical protein